MEIDLSAVLYPEFFWAYKYIYLLCTRVELKDPHPVLEYLVLV